MKIIKNEERKKTRNVVNKKSKQLVQCYAVIHLKIVKSSQGLMKLKLFRKVKMASLDLIPQGMVAHFCVSIINKNNNKNVTLNYRRTNSS